MKNFLSGKVWSVFLVAALLLSFTPAPTLAVIYQPGETLNPACPPTDTSCGVTPPTQIPETGLNLTSATTTPSLTDNQLYNLNSVLYWGATALAGLSAPVSLSSLNGLATSTQAFAVGSAGVNFNIVSSSSTHTFNIPTASSTARGLLSSTDWATFNSKENTITASTTATYLRGDKTFQMLDTSVVPENGNIYYTATRFNTDFASKTTSYLTEGVNLYYTDARARSTLSATAPISYSTSTGAFSLVTGNITAPSNPEITIGGGTGAVVGSGVTISVPEAGATTRGLISTGTQTFAGAKTFSSVPTFSTMNSGSVLFANVGGLVSQDNSNLFWDNTNSRLGIGTSIPTSKLDIAGDIAITNGVEKWNVGIDEADSNKFKISNNTALGVNDRLTIDNFGNTQIKKGIVGSAVPASLTFHANYNTNINGSQGAGALTGTATGVVSVVNGKLDLAAGASAVRYVSYAGAGNADSLQTGAIKIVWTPDYNGFPASADSPNGGFTLFQISQAVDSSVNRIRLQHRNFSGSNLELSIRNSAGTDIIFTNLGPFAAVAGQSYEFELNYDLTAGATRLFINGAQFGATQTQTGIRSGAVNVFRVGSTASSGSPTNADFFIDNISVFNAVQHTANYTPVSAEFEATKLGLSFIEDAATGLINTGVSLDFHHNNIKTMTLNNGNVGIGTAAPAQLLHIVRSTDGVVARFTDANGDCDINPTAGISCASDVSLKKNILTIDNTALEKVLSLNPIIFNWNGEKDDATTHLGFIAQEVEVLFPALVSTNEDGLKSIAYSNFAPILVKAVQEIVSLADSFKQSLIAWFADAANGIADFFAKKIHTEQICLKKADGSEYCVNGDDLEVIMQAPLEAARARPIPIRYGTSSAPLPLTGQGRGEIVPAQTQVVESSVAGQAEQSLPIIENQGSKLVDIASSPLESQGLLTGQATETTVEEASSTTETQSTEPALTNESTTTPTESAQVLDAH